MIQVLASVWALLIGVVLIMLGNGMHFTLIGLRGGIEGFSSAELAIVTSGYFAGFLSGARITPQMIKRVGHVRVFAALGSFTSAGLIALPLIAEPWAWTILRVILGFCMSGIYVTAESWLNDASTNETRGKVLSAYMIAQTFGIIGAQGLLTFGDAATSALFIVASILVSISFAPILLSATSVPMTEAARPMPLKELFMGSPLSTVGIFLLGCVYATQTGMAAVFGTQIEMTTGQIATFVAMLFGGALLFQYPIGWLSDRMDRRKLIFGAAMVAMGACTLGWAARDDLLFLMCAAFVAGGMTTPLYALFLAYTNDFLPLEDMPAASGGLVLTFGIGAILGPLLAGWAMENLGPQSFWLVLAGTFAVISVYALYRMTVREALPVEETESYVGVLPTASPMAVETAGVWAAEQAEVAAEEAAEEAKEQAEASDTEAETKK
ncbi:MFS transporter [Thalassospira australica]|uniref:MFS transporter n=1 Tax=Thalassospira australica TaxID=1528106 RepID=UPI00051A2E42|nr:MFS transporter [Thalassospira australica]